MATRKGNIEELINGRKPLLSLEKLMIGYRQGRRESILGSGLDCNVYRGELVSLMGRNGSGKSTLLRTIAGLQQKLYGRIMLDGKFIEDYGKKELARKMGFVSTDVIRVEGLRVRDLVAMGRFPHTGWFGSLSAKDQGKVDEAIEMCSLELLRHRDLDELSDGERQRAMIARTLAQDTDLLVLDEPTAFLDLVHRHEITLLLSELAREHGKTIVFSSHDLQLSLKTADKIWMIHGGRILEGAPEDMVLDGRLKSGLLEEENIRMDPESAELEMDREYLITVSLEAKDPGLRIWTRKALERIRIGVEENKRMPVHVLVKGSAGSRSDGNAPVWTFENEKEKIDFNSLYDLSLFLRSVL